jgi:hypothetical protein
MKKKCQLGFKTQEFKLKPQDLTLQTGYPSQHWFRFYMNVGLYHMSPNLHWIFQVVLVKMFPFEVIIENMSWFEHVK